MKHIVPAILIIFALLGVSCSIAAAILTFSLQKQDFLFFPAVMLTVVAAITNICTLLPSIVLKSKLTRLSAVISGLGLAGSVIAFIVLASL